MGRSAAAGVARMRAWRAHCYGPPAELRLEEARVPALRAPDHLLVRVRTASINPLDVAMIGGYGARVLNALRSLEGVDVEFPLVVGRDFCGDVAQAGSACTFRTGRRVWGVLPPHWPGSHAQYVVVRDRWVGEAPSALGDLEAGGALYAALSACAALRAAGLPPRAATVRRPAPRVLLLGLGGVGHAALQLLQYSGAQVVVGCASELCPRALALGAVAALDRHAEDYDRALEELGPAAGVTGGAGTCRAAQVRWAFFSPSGEDIQLLRRLADDGKFAVAVERAYPWWAGGAAYERAAAGSARGKLLLDFTAAPRDAPGAVAQ
ncbi:reticulon-4-interacting protein 1, mitochondrial-like isoform X2 [Battus philenor]|uniref:reticulon-4-interacting protein 1, mitochondrial-like isoform X2 n=1 Tax=Battus philenor TaxID=42288 RepID=UPI0035D0DC13